MWKNQNKFKKTHEYVRDEKSCVDVLSKLGNKIEELIRFSKESNNFHIEVKKTVADMTTLFNIPQTIPMHAIPWRKLGVRKITL